MVGMMNPEEMEPQDDDGNWRVIIETPKGSRNKYRFDAQLGAYRLSQVLPEGSAFPYDFGFIPSTIGGDGDPLDVLLLMEEPAFCGCVVPARLIGMIVANQTEPGRRPQRNDRLLAVALTSRRYERVRSLADLSRTQLDDLCGFFVNYNHALGRRFEVIARRGPSSELAAVRRAQARFAKRAAR